MVVRSTSARVWAAAGLLAVGCGAEEAAPCGLRPRPLAAAVGFDANSDGIVDVADGTWLLARHFRGGEDPPCLAAIEAYDPLRDAATAYAIWYSLISGAAQPDLAAGACEAPPPDEGACGGGLALSIDAPASASGPVGGSASFEAEVQLTSPDLAAEGWSLSVAADGCAVEAATVAGTAAADQRDDPPGQRSGGVAMAEPTAGGAASLVVLDPVGGAGIRPKEAETVLILRVSAPVGSSCSSCRLDLADGQAGQGRPLANAVAAAGRSYAPPARGADVEICPDP